MLTAIQFYDQHGLWAYEIGDISGYGNLAPETKAFHLPTAEEAPEMLFCICCVVA